ncbi:hypothetical protein H3U06_18670 [Clostridioides difficile]|nr:hypothetical protein [Clostridioides difficile]
MPSFGASDDHGDDGDDHKVIKCSTWKRRKRKTTTLLFALGIFIIWSWQQ